MSRGALIPTHGGYRRLKSFQVAQLAYDLTVRFRDLSIDRRSRTHDQMVQAARSGVQNIAEGSQASGTSKKMELKLTNVARASLEELRLDYEDFLRQRHLPRLAPHDPVLTRLKARRCARLDEVRAWVEEERRRDPGSPTRTDTESHGPARTGAGSVVVGGGPCSSKLSSACLAANAALSLLNLACYLLDRQVDSLARAFQENGGFTERLYQARQARRRG